MPRKRFPPPLRLYRMASPTRGECVSSSASSFSATDSRARSTRRRQSSISATMAASYVAVAPCSATKIGELEAPVIALDEALHLAAGVGELLRRATKAFDTFLEQPQ